MTFEELAESIAIKNDNNSYEFKEMLKSDIISARATVIKREYEKTRIYNSVLIQTLDCVELVPVSSTECKINGQELTTLKSKYKIPKPLLVKDSTLFISITTPFVDNKRVNLSVVKPEEVEYIKYRKFTKNSVFVTYENDHIFVHGKLGQSIKFLKLRDVFANPFEVKKFKDKVLEDSNCQCEDCEVTEDSCFEDNDLIIDETLTEGIKSFIYNELNRYKKSDSEIKINE